LSNFQFAYCALIWYGRNHGGRVAITEISHTAVFSDTDSAPYLSKRPVIHSIPVSHMKYVLERILSKKFTLMQQTQTMFI